MMDIAIHRANKSERVEEGNKLVCRTIVAISALALLFILHLGTSLSDYANVGIALGYGVVGWGIVEISYKRKEIAIALSNCFNAIAERFKFKQKTSI